MCVGGLQESTGTFSQFSRQVGGDQEDEEEVVPREISKTKQRGTNPPVPSTTDTAAAVTKKKTVVRKPKAVVKYDFDEFVREVGKSTNCGLT